MTSNLNSGVILGLGAVTVVAAAGVVHQRSMRSPASGSAARTRPIPRAIALVKATARERILGQPIPTVIEVARPVGQGTGRARLVLPHHASGNGVAAFHYGENLLVLVSDPGFPMYTLTLYSADDAGTYRVDQDIVVSGLAEVEEFLGKRFQTLRPFTIASKLLDRMS